MKPCYRCGHPGQQHGRRFPADRLSHPKAIRFTLVSSFLAEVIQQIHSFRASGVMSSHVASAAGIDSRALRTSAGMSCTTPPEIRSSDFFGMQPCYATSFHS